GHGSSGRWYLPRRGGVSHSRRPRSNSAGCASVPRLLAGSTVSPCGAAVLGLPILPDSVALWLASSSSSVEKNYTHIDKFLSRFCQNPLVTSGVIDIQVCFWKAKRPVRVPNRFLHSRVQKVLTPCQDAWQSTPEPSPPIPSTAQIP